MENNNANFVSEANTDEMMEKSKSSLNEEDNKAIDNTESSSEEDDMLIPDDYLDNVKPMEFDANEDQIRRLGNAYIQDEYMLTKKDATKFLDMAIKYHNDKDNLSDDDIINGIPDNIKELLDIKVISSGDKRKELADLFRETLEEVFTNSKSEAEFQMLQEELDKIMNSPSIPDMYFEESCKNIRKILPDTIKKLMEEDAEENKEKISKLLKVQDAFERSIDLKEIRDIYDTHANTRRNVRRFTSKVNRYMDIIDTIYKGKVMKIPSCKDARESLLYIANGDKWKSTNGITTEDIDEFFVMLYYTFALITTGDFVSEVKVYYILKNISMLRYTNTNKTEFTTEYIKNIIDFILHIKSVDKEALTNRPNKKHSNKKKR